MKKLCFLMMMLVSISSFAQQKESRRKQMKERAAMNMTAEEKAILKSKRLTLDLDLTEHQQKEFQKLYVNHAEEKHELKEDRKEAAKNSNLREQSFEQMNARLDREIAFQQAMLEILSKEQYELWKATKRMAFAERQKR
ncbi:hypothetical protein [Zunongwangia endophytica]|uniref:LTXXQ motif family protein n=1 Tax=Zunongwangia endophytica TaxID=1808945 RepID=A0ABV8HAI6_9FLAO|nr:hypothetical protein [Zunongwangia endophytica]MDN3596358.1 hypothetical protein [Zunongwangia endophytica]